MGVITVYTDGACGHGHGGWGWWVSDDQFDSGAQDDTTNNVMELRAVIEALKAMPAGLPVEIVSDSAYVVNCFLERWYVGWRQRGWVSSKKKPVANRDVWEELLTLVEARRAETVWTHVRGHVGIIGNEKADRLAVAAKMTLYTLDQKIARTR